MSKNEQKQVKTLSGKVISDKMDKTFVAKTERTFTHPLFHKIMRVSKNYKVHDESNEASIGDIVEFREGRPVSKTKHMYLVRIIKKSA